MILEGTLANDKVDKHGEAMSVGALKTMAADISSYWIPMGVEHDPRIPPQGRILSASLRQEADGSTAVVGRVELFDPNVDYPYLSGSGRRLRVRATDTMAFVVDRGSSAPEVLPLAKEVAGLLNTRLASEIKKSVELLTLVGLVIGTYLLGEIAGGFLKKLGADIYDSVKVKIKEVVAAHRRAVPSAERLFTLHVGVSSPAGIAEVEIILENPDPADIDRLLDAGLPKLQQLLSRPGLLDPQIARLVFMYRDGRLSLHYAVRHDAVPLDLGPRDSDV